MNNLMQKLLDSGSKISNILSESPFFNAKDMIQTDIPVLNVALSGDIEGGLTPGLTVISGPSKTFKTCMSLYMVSAYFKKYPESICLYFDSEFGSSPEYLKAMGVDPARVLHIPVEHIEQLKFDIVKKLEQIQKNDKVIILIDSIGNVASKKELEDAIEEKSVADMTRAKAIRSLFRIITPTLTIKDIPCLCIAHVYQEMGLYPKQIVGGGTSIMYSANTVWIISRAQEKEGDVLVGYQFTINVEKSRYVKEKSKIPIVVNFNSGISKWSGLLDICLELNFIVKPTKGWYQLVDFNTGEILEKKYREKELANEAFWNSILSNEKFKEQVRNKFQLSQNELLQDEI